MLPPAGQPVYQHKTRIVIATLVVTLTSTYRTTTARVWTPCVELPTQTMPALGWREAAVLRPSRGDRKPSRRQAKARLDRCDSVEAQLTPPLQATRGGGGHGGRRYLSSSPTLPSPRSANKPCFVDQIASSVKDRHHETADKRDRLLLSSRTIRRVSVKNLRD